MKQALNLNKLGVLLLSAALAISFSHTVLTSLEQLVLFNYTPPTSDIIVRVIMVGVLYLFHGLLIFLIARGKDIALFTLIVCYLCFLPMRFMPLEGIDSLESRFAIIAWPAVSVILQAIGLICLVTQRRILAGMITGCLIWVVYIVFRFPAALDAGLLIALPLYVAIPCYLSVMLGLVLNSNHIAGRWHLGGLVPAVVLIFGVSGVCLLFLGSGLSLSTELERAWIILGVFGLLFTIVNWPDPSRIQGLTYD